MSEIEYAARALLKADHVFGWADGNGEWEPPTWEQIGDDGREDYRTRAKVFLDEYAKAGADASDKEHN